MTNLRARCASTRSLRKSQCTPSRGSKTPAISVSFPSAKVRHSTLFILLFFSTKLVMIIDDVYNNNNNNNNNNNSSFKKIIIINAKLTLTSRTGARGGYNQVHLVSGKQISLQQLSEV